MRQTARMLQHLALGRGNLDRMAERRTDSDWFAGVCAAPDTVVIGVDGAGVAMDGDHLANLRDSAVVEPAEAVLLGACGGRVHVAWMHPGLAGTRSLRDIGVLLSDDEAALATAAVAVHQWHRAHTRCPRCGAATVPAASGWERQCPEDGSSHYPRTDPAVIVRIVDSEDRLLLARQPVWPDGRLSLVAGYLEPGETAEHAVGREVLEEVGLPVRDLRYLGSQPWPFPASLMLCYQATAEHTDFQVDGVEIEFARWFTRAELLSAVADGSVGLPSGVSIARRAIEDWLGHEVAD